MWNADCPPLFDPSPKPLISFTICDTALRRLPVSSSRGFCPSLVVTSSVNGCLKALRAASGFDRARYSTNSCN